MCFCDFKVTDSLAEVESLDKKKSLSECTPSTEASDEANVADDVAQIPWNSRDGKVVLKFGNAPISWGVSEFEGNEIHITPDKMLDELKEAGYTGTELGDLGFFPVADLKSYIQSRHNLDMIGAFCAYELWNPAKHEEGRAYARKLATQLKLFADQEFVPPYIVLADRATLLADAVSVPVRIQNAGKITKRMGLQPAEWKILADEVAFLKRTIWDEFKVEVFVHPHCGGYIETPWEIEQLCHDLIFDTAHITMGAHARPMYLVEFLKKFPSRIKSFHFKDYDPCASGKDYFELVENGCFPELGKGMCDFEGVKSWIREISYKGWVLVEQDILDLKTQNPKHSAQRNCDFLKQLFADMLDPNACL